MAKITGIIVLNSSFRLLKISDNDIKIVKGQKIVVMRNITKDKNFSSILAVG
ncbi:hypothetical protein [Nodularia sp. NIES-3585]|uniref:hypothetical protein n=1 Tax=Nodularia sp. NIES-3585 TaxID=1973477 RepID=UPI001C3E47A9|nr:hypothetical protein [Nodularia sp. NIES-3585]